ncbi:hypothetical protein LP123_07510 [Moraxella bovis]|uniref:hypothetical protein n=1 Tax=Moraxella bovis TaxID=476 RepID=UPI002225D766|nr:hypothetical protein [Moraxella bovis]UYZ79830.1 hypothetical protein LP113_07095 [Moraxella bovis]UZA07457.1 hypothetical protein LP099_06775 [Moraxella bovis]UZA10307.1 hypothetical protein LP123_07510 [Moraxella bovis]
MITQDNLVLLKAENQSDFDDGGGLPTTHTVPNHTSNALFPDVSDTDRMMGRVRLRKIFLGVRTANDELVQSARLIFTKIPHKMSVFAFKASAFSDRRTHAKDRIESYLARGSRWSGHLLESHLKGQRVIQLSLDPTDSVPSVGNSLVIIQNENQADERYQFVRVSKVSTEIRKFPISREKTATRLIASLEITDSLRHDFDGLSVLEYLDGVSEKRKALVRDTIVADAAQYYSASHLAQPITAMTTQTVNLESIYVQVVPSTQVETPLVQNNPSMNSVFFVKGNDDTVSQTFVTSATNQLGAVYPTSLTVNMGGAVYHDDNGEIKNGNTAIGAIAYETGVITWYAGNTGRGATVSFIPAGYQTGANATEVIAVPKIGAGYNYVYTLANTPLPLSVKVSYQSNGEVYTLTDNGGKLIGQGSGVINDKTLVLTTSAIPDSESLIIISYGTDNGAIAVGGIQKPLYAHVKTDKMPSAVEIDGVNSTFDMTDDGLKVYFDKLPAKGSQITLKGANSHIATDGNGATVSSNSSGLTIKLNNPIVRGTLSLEIMGCVFGDDGKGNVVFRSGYEKILGTQQDSSGNFLTGKATQETTITERTTNTAGEIMGVVDYGTQTISLTKPLKVQMVQTQNYSKQANYIMFSGV